MVTIGTWPLVLLPDHEAVIAGPVDTPASQAKFFSQVARWLATTLGTEVDTHPSPLPHQPDRVVFLTDAGELSAPLSLADLIDTHYVSIVQQVYADPTTWVVAKEQSL